MTLVYIQPVDREGANGDRATTKSPYRDYRIHVLTEEEPTPNANTQVHEVGGYDGFYSSIKDKEVVILEVKQFTEKLARRIGAEVSWGPALNRVDRLKTKLTDVVTPYLEGRPVGDVELLVAELHKMMKGCGIK